MKLKTGEVKRRRGERRRRDEEGGERRRGGSKREERRKERRGVEKGENEVIGEKGTGKEMRAEDRRH